MHDEGSAQKGTRFAVGSGSPYAYGVIDSFYDYNMTLEEAVQLGRRAIYHAGHRDGMSGGCVRVYHIHAGGWTKIIAGEDVNAIHDEMLAKKGMVGYKDEVVLG